MGPLALMVAYNCYMDCGSHLHGSATLNGVVTGAAGGGPSAGWRAVVAVISTSSTTCGGVLVVTEQPAPSQPIPGQHASERVGAFSHRYTCCGCGWAFPIQVGVHDCMCCFGGIGARTPRTNMAAATFRCFVEVAMISPSPGPAPPARTRPGVNQSTHTVVYDRRDMDMRE